MKKVLYLLLFITACKSSSQEEVDRIALIRERVLNEDITVAYRPETFKGDIAHISEVYCRELKAGDGYVRRDTTLKEYSFKDHRLHQIATVTKRMPYDTLTIRYDSAGRIFELINSDDRRVIYNVDRFKYDAAGRRIEKANRVYSTESRRSYEYNNAGDSLVVKGADGTKIKDIYIGKKEDHVTVTNVINAGTIVYEFDEHNQLVGIYVYEDNKASYKVSRKYDSQGNPVSWEQYTGDHMTREGFGKMNESLSFTTIYTYDNTGNWTIKKEQPKDKGWSGVTMRKITYK